MIFIIIIGKNTKKFRLKHDSKVSFCCIAIFIALATRHEIEYQRHSTRQQYAQNNNEQKKMSVGRISNSRSNRIIFFFFCSLFVGKYCIVEIRETSISAFGACENVENANTSAKPNMSILPVAITACHTYIQLPPCPIHTKNCIVKEM